MTQTHSKLRIWNSSEMCGWSRTGMAAIILDKWQISRNMMSVSWLLANRWLYSTQFCCISLLVEDLEFTRSSSVCAYMPLFLETCKRLIFSQQTNKLLCLANKNVHSSHTDTGADVRNKYSCSASVDSISSALFMLQSHAARQQHNTISLNR